MYGGAKSVASADFRGLRHKKVWPRPSCWEGLRPPGFGRNSGGRFSAREGCWRLQNRGERVLCGACTQYDPKVILGAQTLDPKGDEYYGSWES